MIGLAAVILLIGLASAIFSSANREPPMVAVGAPETATVVDLTITNSALAGDPANEPLAELGVAPSTTEGNAAVPAPAPTAR